jgi:hypothetical protein
MKSIKERLEAVSDGPPELTRQPDGTWTWTARVCGGEVSVSGHPSRGGLEVRARPAGYGHFYSHPCLSSALSRLTERERYFRLAEGVSLRVSDRYLWNGARDELTVREAEVSVQGPAGSLYYGAEGYGEGPADVFALARGVLAGDPPAALLDRLEELGLCAVGA